MSIIVIDILLFYTIDIGFMCGIIAQQIGNCNNYRPTSLHMSSEQHIFYLARSSNNATVGHRQLYLPRSTTEDNQVNYELPRNVDRVLKAIRATPAAYTKNGIPYVENHFKNMIERYSDDKTRAKIANWLFYSLVAMSLVGPRKDGEPFFTHPVAVAEIGLEFTREIEESPIMKANRFKMRPSIFHLMYTHDISEDTRATQDDMRRFFGKDQANTLYALMEDSVMLNKTKQDRALYSHTIDHLFEGRLQAIIVKLCDRLHNMRTLEYMSKDKQEQKAIDTLWVHEQLASLLELPTMYAELRRLDRKYWPHIYTASFYTESSPLSYDIREFRTEMQKKLNDFLVERTIRKERELQTSKRRV